MATLEDLRQIGLELPGATESIKWDNHLCLCVGDKMFLIMGLDNTPTTASFKVDDEDFLEMCEMDGLEPAPYMARNKWIWTSDISNLPISKWKEIISKSHHIIGSKLSQKKQKELGLL